MVLCLHRSHAEQSPRRGEELYGVGAVVGTDFAESGGGSLQQADHGPPGFEPPLMMSASQWEAALVKAAAVYNYFKSRNANTNDTGAPKCKQWRGALMW